MWNTHTHTHTQNSILCLYPESNIVLAQIWLVSGYSKSQWGPVLFGPQVFILK